MSSPTLTFTPAMFHASESGAKDTTRRLAQVSRQNDIDQLAAHIADDNELAFWQEHTHLCAHQPGETKPMVTNWCAGCAFDNWKPSDIEPTAARSSSGIWFENGSVKPMTSGKLRPGRFLPKSLYHLAPQVEILTVHPEFLHDITLESAIREGVSPADALIGSDSPLLREDHAQRFPKERLISPNLPITRYFKLWDTINAEKDHGQHAAANNPVVWVITYRLKVS